MWRPLLLLILAATPVPGLADESTSLLQATTHEPRAFGYQVGDVVVASSHGARP